MKLRPGRMDEEGRVFDFKKGEFIYRIEKDGEVRDLKTGERMGSIGKDGRFWDDKAERYTHTIEENGRVWDIRRGKYSFCIETYRPPEALDDRKRPVESYAPSGGGGGGFPGIPLPIPGTLQGCLAGFFVAILLMGFCIHILDDVVIPSIESGVIKKIWPTYETEAEKVLKLKMERMEREMPLNATPIQITKEMPPITITEDIPFGTEKKPIRFSDGAKLYSLNRPRVDYGGPGATIFIERGDGKKMIADHTGFPCEGLAISPDESRISYFVGTAKGATLRIIDREGVLIREFTHIFWGLPTNLSYSPDGKFIVFSTQYNDGVSGNEGIYIVNIQAGAVRRLTRNGRYPIWLPGGNEIAFTFQNKIYIVNKNSYLVRRVLE